MAIVGNRIKAEGTRDEEVYFWLAMTYDIHLCGRGSWRSCSYCFHPDPVLTSLTF